MAWTDCSHSGDRQKHLSMGTMEPMALPPAHPGSHRLWEQLGAVPSTAPAAEIPSTGTLPWDFGCHVDAMHQPLEYKGSQA